MAIVPKYGRAREYQAKDRTYTVWVKGNKASTEYRVEAPFKINALIKCGNKYGVKSFQCDGRLERMKKNSKRPATRKNPRKSKIPRRRRRYAPKGFHFEKRSKPVVKRGVMFVGRSTLVKDKPKRNPFSGHMIIGKDRKSGRAWYYDGDKAFIQSKAGAERYSSHETAYRTAQRLIKGRYVPERIVALEIRK